MDACADKVAVLQYNTLPADDPIVAQVLSNLEECQGQSITIKEVMEAIQMVANTGQTITGPRAFDEACNSLFSAAELDDGLIGRAALRQTLLRNKGALHNLIEQEPVCKAIMKNLEEVGSGLISKEELMDTIIAVSEANGKTVGQAQANALVNALFNSQNAARQSGIDRQQVKQAIFDNVAKVKAVTEVKEGAATKGRMESTSAPKTNPLLSEVMQILDGNASGTIERSELQEALVRVVQKNQVHLDVGALVEGIYDQQETLTRLNIRTALEHNSVEIRSNLIEPIQNQILR
jgi:Ca2+-binding EF-hand superfamily protein